MRFPNRLARHWGGAASNITALALVTLVAGGLRAPAETKEIPTRDMRIRASSVEPGRLPREIDDPSSGARWLLVGDKTNPGGPGRLELAPRVPLTDPGAGGRRTNAPQVGQTRPVTMIRPGDKLVVEEHSPTTDAYLEGVALGPAGPGTTLHVRLSIGGRVVRAVAVGPGRATLGAFTEAGR
jgi:hypothetical protein